FLGLRVTGMRWTFPLVHLGAVVLLVAFTTATIVFTYGLVGRFVDRNRFGSVAAWSQAGLSAAFLGFSQVLAHLLELPRFRLDRAPKTRLYPSLGFFLLLPVAQLFSRATYSLTAGAFVSVLILGMLPSVILEALRISSHHAATEVFAAVPLGSAAPLFQGTR